MLPALGTALLVGVVTGIGGVVSYTVFKAANTGEEKNIMPMGTPRSESERVSQHEAIYGKGAIPPLERLGRAQTVNDMMPMSPNLGPPLPRSLNVKWPWKK